MKEIRNIFIGAKVTPSQKEYIKESADKCGMSVSDYLLARAYNYEPKRPTQKRFWAVSLFYYRKR